MLELRSDRAASFRATAEGRLSCPPPLCAGTRRSWWRARRPRTCPIPGWYSTRLAARCEHGNEFGVSYWDEPLRPTHLAAMSRHFVRVGPRVNLENQTNRNRSPLVPATIVIQPVASPPVPFWTRDQLLGPNRGPVVLSHPVPFWCRGSQRVRESRCEAATTTSWNRCRVHHFSPPFPYLYQPFLT